MPDNEQERGNDEAEGVRLRMSLIGIFKSVCVCAVCVFFVLTSCKCV